MRLTLRTFSDRMKDLPSMSPSVCRSLVASLQASKASIMMHTAIHCTLYRILIKKRDPKVIRLFEELCQLQSRSTFIQTLDQSQSKLSLLYSRLKCQILINAPFEETLTHYRQEFFSSNQSTFEITLAVKTAAYLIANKTKFATEMFSYFIAQVDRFQSNQLIHLFCTASKQLKIVELKESNQSLRLAFDASLGFQDPKSEETSQKSPLMSLSSLCMFIRGQVERRIDRMTVGQLEETAIKIGMESEILLREFIRQANSTPFYLRLAYQLRSLIAEAKESVLEVSKTMVKEQLNHIVYLTVVDYQSLHLFLRIAGNHRLFLQPSHFSQFSLESKTNNIQFEAQAYLFCLVQYLAGHINQRPSIKIETQIIYVHKILVRHFNSPKWSQKEQNTQLDKQQKNLTRKIDEQFYDRPIFVSVHVAALALYAVRLHLHNRGVPMSELERKECIDLIEKNCFERRNYANNLNSKMNKNQKQQKADGQQCYNASNIFQSINSVNSTNKTDDNTFPISSNQVTIHPPQLSIPQLNYIKRWLKQNSNNDYNYNLQHLYSKWNINNSPKYGLKLKESKNEDKQSRNYINNSDNKNDY